MEWDVLISILSRCQEEIRLLLLRQEQLYGMLMQQEKERGMGLMDAETLCCRLNIRRRTLNEYVRKFNIPEYRQNCKPYYRWEEVEQQITKRKGSSE